MNNYIDKRILRWIIILIIGISLMVSQLINNRMKDFNDINYIIYTTGYIVIIMNFFYYCFLPDDKNIIDKIKEVNSH